MKFEVSDNLATLMGKVITAWLISCFGNFHMKVNN